MGRVIAYCLDKKDGFDLQQLQTPQQLTELYIAASQRAKDDPAFAEQSLQATLCLQEGRDQAIDAIWKHLCAVSRKGFQELQEWFGVEPVERGESFYKEQLPGIVGLLQKEGLAVPSEGAQCVFVPNGKQDAPFIVQKKDGSFLYATTDLAAMYHRTQQLKCQRIVILTDSAQQLHFHQLFYLAKQLRWLTLSDKSNKNIDRPISTYKCQRG